MSKKILIVSQNFYPEIGSAGNRMKNIYLLLRKSGYDVDVLTTDPTYPNKKIYQDDQFWDNEEINQNSLNIKRVKISNKKYTRSIMNRLIYYIEMAIKMLFFVIKSRGKYDIVYTSSPPIFIAIVGLFAKFKYRSKLILDIRDLWPESLKGVGVFNSPVILSIFRKVEKLLYKKSNEIIVNSKGFIDYIESKSDSFKNKITYIPNGARLSEVSLGNRASSSFKVIYAGNIGLAQDAEILMKLAKALDKKNIEFTIIGYGLRRQGLKEFVEREKLGNVTFLNPLTREDCLRIISVHHVGIVTLVDKDVFKTVLPGKVIDYMTCGVPIVGSVSGFSKEIITKQNAGFVSESKDAEELLKYIGNLYKNPGLRNEISDNATKYVKENFLWESNIKSLLKIINTNKSM